jgi:hypothetical protein
MTIGGSVAGVKAEFSGALLQPPERLAMDGKAE